VGNLVARESLKKREGLAPLLPLADNEVPFGRHALQQCPPRT